MGESKTDISRYILISCHKFLSCKNKRDTSCALYYLLPTCYPYPYDRLCEILTVYSFTGGLLSYFRNLLGNREMRILILGLDGAGKTTILYRFARVLYFSDRLSFVFTWCVSTIKSFWHGFLYSEAIRD